MNTTRTAAAITADASIIALTPVKVGQALERVEVAVRIADVAAVAQHKRTLRADFARAAEAHRRVASDALEVGNLVAFVHHDDAADRFAARAAECAV